MKLKQSYVSKCSYNILESPPRAAAAVQHTVNRVGAKPTGGSVLQQIQTAGLTFGYRL